MAQHDFVINNQGFPAFRSDLNDFLNAVRTTHSGTSTPSGAVAGTIWLDTTSATTPTLKYYDGTDNISLATIDHSANTVNWLDSTVSVTGVTTTATGTVLTLTDTDNTTSVNLIIDNQKEIRFNETTANGTNYVALKAPASLASNTTFILPSADGTSGQFLKTDGAGNLSFDSLSFATPLAVIGNATAGSEIRLPEDTDNGSNYVALKAPDTLASNLTLTLPSADGSSGQVLQTNGSGVLSFASGGGKVLQVVSATKVDTQSFTFGLTRSDITGLSVTLTPASASNKVLVRFMVSHWGDDSHCQIERSIAGGSYSIISPPNSDGSRTLTHSGGSHRGAYELNTATMEVLDSPNTTSSTVYKITMNNGACQTSGNPGYVNRSDNNDDNACGERAISTVTAMEIAV